MKNSVGGKYNEIIDIYKALCCFLEGLFVCFQYMLIFLFSIV